MALNPEDKPREFLVLVIAALRYSFAPDSVTAAQTFDEAEQFVAEAERRYGPIDGP